MGFFYQRRALLRFFTIREQGDRRILDAVADRSEGRRHSCKLNQHRRRALGISSRIHEGSGLATKTREFCRDTGSLHPLDTTHAQERRAHGGPGVSSRHHGAGFRVAHELSRANERGILLCPNRRTRFVIHRNHLGT